MGISGTVLLLSGMLMLALVVRPVAARIRLPFAAVLVATGFVGAEVLVAFEFDTGVRYDAFHDLIFYVFLPVLVFAGAFQIDPPLLRNNLVVILVYAVPVLLLSVGITATLIYFGIGHPSGFPWTAALLTGALLAATDASPLTSQFPQLGAPRRLRVLLEGEDLFNDGVAIVAFSIFLYAALHPSADISAADAVTRFLVVFVGGMLSGLLTGLVFLLVSRLFEDPVQQALVTLISAYSSYLLAEQALNVSGVMSVLLTGLIMGRAIHDDLPDRRDSFVDTFWEFNVYVAEALVFLLMGVTITVAMFEERWLAMIIGIAAVLLARAVGVFGTAPLISRLPGIEPLDRDYQRIIYLGSMRGAVVLALALSIPVELPYWWTIQSIAFGVVVFALFVQAPAARALLLKSGLGNRKAVRE